VQNLKKHDAVFIKMDVSVAEGEKQKLR